MPERSSRSVGYSKEEDKFLCQVYVQIFQDPITGVHQTADHFWNRVVEAFKNGKNAIWSERSKKSIQCRFQTIERATKKLHACIKQCENRRPNGASNDDVLNQAKEMLMEDPKFKSGWKFDHVWNIIKNFEKFQDCVVPAKKATNSCGVGHTSLETEKLDLDSATQASPGLSSLNLDGEEDIIGGSLSQRPTGVKKFKRKRRRDDQISYVIKTLEERNRQLLEQLNKTNEQRQHHLEIQNKNYALKELKEENKFLFQNLSSIQDPNIRAYVQTEQTRILKKRVDQQASSPSISFEQYLNDLH